RGDCYKRQERLHERLRYDRDEGGWKHRYLQP
ncbi:pyridoxine 5'-phosphate oxidase C-terminal domain-containing protein, partial [Pseudomonas aeruginosa]